MLILWLTHVVVTLTLLDLARNQASQSKLRHEIAALGDSELDFETVQKLEYLDAVIREGYATSSILKVDIDCNSNRLLILPDFVSILLHRLQNVLPPKTT